MAKGVGTRRMAIRGIAKKTMTPMKYQDKIQRGLNSTKKGAIGNYKNT